MTIGGGGGICNYSFGHIYSSFFGSKMGHPLPGPAAASPVGP